MWQMESTVNILNADVANKTILKNYLVFKICHVNILIKNFKNNKF